MSRVKIKQNGRRDGRWRKVPICTRKYCLSLDRQAYNNNNNNTSIPSWYFSQPTAVFGWPWEKTLYGKRWYIRMDLWQQITFTPTRSTYVDCWTFFPSYFQSNENVRSFTYNLYIESLLLWNSQSGKLLIQWRWIFWSETDAKLGLALVSILSGTFSHE